MEFSDNEQLTTNCTDSFSNKQMTRLLIALTISGLVSAVLCLIAVIVVLRYTLYKFFVYRLALYQILSCLVFSVAEALQLMTINYGTGEDTYHHIACQFTAFLNTYTVWVKLILTLSLVFHIYVRAVYLKDLKKLEIVYIVISFLIPGFIASVPLITKYYGLAGGWCWIRDWKKRCASDKDTVGIIHQFSVWYGPLTIFLFICLIAVVIVVTKYCFWRHCTRCHKTNTNEDANKKAVKELLPLLLYPVIFFVLALFPLINRLNGAISPHDSFGWMMSHAITEALWGSCSALVLIGHVAYVVCKRNHETPASLDHESTPSDCEPLVATTSSGMSNYGAVNDEEM